MLKIYRSKTCQAFYLFFFEGASSYDKISYAGGHALYILQQKQLLRPINQDLNALNEPNETDGIENIGGIIVG